MGCYHLKGSEQERLLDWEKKLMELKGGGVSSGPDQEEERKKEMPLMDKWKKEAIWSSLLCMCEKMPQTHTCVHTHAQSSSLLCETDSFAKRSNKKENMSGVQC